MPLCVLLVRSENVLCSQDEHRLPQEVITPT